MSFKEKFIGRKTEVLVESCVDSGQTCVGLTSNYIRVKVSDAFDNAVNRIAPVLITGVNSSDGLALGLFV